MERDISQNSRKVRKAVGDKIGVAVDCNQRWDVDRCISSLRSCVNHITWHGWRNRSIPIT